MRTLIVLALLTVSGCGASATDTAWRTLSPVASMESVLLAKFITHTDTYENQIADEAIKACQLEPASTYVVCKHTYADPKLATYKAERANVVATAKIASAATGVAADTIKSVEAGKSPESVLVGVVADAVVKLNAATDLMTKVMGLIKGGN